MSEEPGGKTGVVRDSALAGRLLDDRYRLVTRIATGGMGEVWAATDQLLHREVAVKVLRDNLVETPSFLRRFRGEALHAASLTHPGIARVYDYGEVVGDGTPLAYLVMEMVPGIPLSQVLARTGRLSVPFAVSLLIQIADALQAAHEMGLVHRDVKPGNLLVTADYHVKITDFGIARATDAAPMTDVGQISGTPRYMSPEQAAGGEATPASDVYSLAIVAYELLVGHPPFTGEPVAVALAQMHRPPPPLPANMPEAFNALILRALAKDPSRRPADAGTFAAELRQLGLADASPPEPPPIFCDAPTDLVSVHEAPSTDDRTALSPTALLPNPETVSGAPGHPGATPGPPYAAPRDLVSARSLTVTRSHRRLIIASTIILVVLFAVIALRHATDITTTGAVEAVPPATASITLDPPATTTPIVELVTVDRAALIGQPAAQAQNELERAGFVVTRTEIVGPSDQAATVVDVQPNGAVSFGATVVLSVGVTEPTASTIATQPTPKSKGKDKGKGHG